MNTNLKFFKLLLNKKTPIKNENFTNINTLKNIDEINTLYYNVGLSCCHNNLIVLDIDIKDDGIKEFNEYIEKYGDIKTVIQKTQSGGRHYLFKHNSKNYTDEQNELINQLKNKSKYRGKGLDIRKDNGYIVVEPSRIDGKKYEFINHYQNMEILEMPLTLLKWLLEFELNNNNNNNNNNLNIQPIINDNDKIFNIMNENDLIELLKKFDNNNYKLWLKVTACIKNLNNKYNDFNEKQLFKIWDNWSKNKTTYNKNNNIKIWETINFDINFNLLIYQYNMDKTKNMTTTEVEKYWKKYALNEFKTIKNYEELTTDTSNIKILNMNNNYIYDDNYKGVQITQDIFNNNDTILIKSTTGTGKTSNISKFINNYINIGTGNTTFKIMSIVSRKTLSQQHITTFKENNINLISYEDKTKNIEDSDLVICINSLLMYSNYKPEFFKNYVVYIDEISTFLRHLTHNGTLDHSLKLIYTILMKIINNCHKLILSEATINDNVFNIIERRDKTKTIFIKNEFKKYKNIEATQINNEETFLNLVQKYVTDNKHFLFGCDSCDIVTKYFNKCQLINNDKCILITSESQFKINDVNEQFKDKFVFYSPSITCGVDFNILDEQTSFLYINRKTISPSDSFQQLTRTRNLKNCYFYINEQTKNIEPVYKSLENCSLYYIDIATTHNKLNILCTNENEYNELTFNNNTFFKLFIYNEYLEDIYNTNKEEHFKYILKDNGFNIFFNSEEQRKPLKKIIKEELTDLKIKHTYKTFKKHIDKIEINENLDKVINYLNLYNDEDKEKYYNIINDKFLRDDYFNLIKYFHNEEYIINKMKNINIKNVEYKAIYASYNKILLLKQYEKELNIKPLEIEKLEKDINKTISTELYDKIKVSFRSIEDHPQTYNECIEYYIKKLSHIFGTLKIILTERKRINGKKCTLYNIDKNQIKFYFDLNYNKDPIRVNFDNYLLEKFKNEIKIYNEDDDNEFIDNNIKEVEEDEENEYISALDYGILSK